MKRRQFLRSITGAAGLAARGAGAGARRLPWSARPARIIAGFAAGGGVDITALLMGQRLGVIRVPMVVPVHPALPAKSPGELIGGQVQILFAAAPGTVDFIRSGKLRALGVTSPTQAEVLK